MLLLRRDTKPNTRYFLVVTIVLLQDFYFWRAAVSQRFFFQSTAVSPVRRSHTGPFWPWKGGGVGRDIQMLRSGPGIAIERNKPWTAEPVARKLRYPWVPTLLLIARSSRHEPLPLAIRPSEREPRQKKHRWCISAACFLQTEKKGITIVIPAAGSGFEGAKRVQSSVQGTYRGKKRKKGGEGFNVGYYIVC